MLKASFLFCILKALPEHTLRCFSACLPASSEAVLHVFFPHDSAVMPDLTDILTHGDNAERIRQYLGPRVRWMAQLHQVSMFFCDFLHNLLVTMQVSFQVAEHEEDHRDTQTWLWRIQREPHLELRDVVMMQLDEGDYITEEEAMRMLQRDFGAIDSDDGWETSSSGRWSWGS